LQCFFFIFFSPSLFFFLLALLRQHIFLMESVSGRLRGLLPPFLPFAVEFLIDWLVTVPRAPPLLFSLDQFLSLAVFGVFRPSVFLPLPLNIVGTLLAAKFRLLCHPSPPQLVVAPKVVPWLFCVTVRNCVFFFLLFETCSFFACQGKFFFEVLFSLISKW